MPGASKGKTKEVKQTAPIFVLKVAIFQGPMTDEFLDDNEEVSRVIEIKGSQTLKSLHKIIFHAFDREDEHMYEFQIGGDRPMDPSARRFVPPIMLEDAFGDNKPAGTVDAKIGSIGLCTGDVFLYWFDFGDDWWHQIEVVDICQKAATGKYPKIISRIGNSPPQYADWEEL